MPRIHWLGTGLSSIPGLKMLLKKKYDVFVWNRTLEKAQSLLGDLTNNICKFDLNELEKEIIAGDVIISMLPASHHLDIAKLCLKKNANFISSSYISEELQELNSDVKKQGLVFLSEVGLDPGIDHLMAHDLVKQYKESYNYSDDNTIEFYSFCGGVPKKPNEFCYKFSWSPLGVLKALKSPAKSIEEFNPVETLRPWHNVKVHEIPSFEKEKFEVYPNRDSLPFINQYDFENNWKLKKFVRGTLRNLGWKKAWQDIFQNIENINIDSDYKKLENLSNELWDKYSYKEEEEDRVVLNVSLKASQKSNVKFERSYLLDAWGDKKYTAMARLVSIPVALAVEAILKNKISIGVSPAPKSSEIVTDWLDEIKKEAQIFKFINKS